MTVTLVQARQLQAAGVHLRVATIHQTMGPNWREIIYIAELKTARPYVSDTHAVAAIRKLLKESTP